MIPFQIDPTRLLIAGCILAATLLVRVLLEKVVLRAMIRVTSLTSMRHDDLVLSALKPPFTWFVLGLGVFLALVELQLPTQPWNLPHWIDLAWKWTEIGLVIWALFRLITPVAAFLDDHLMGSDESAQRQFSPILTGLLRFLLVALSATFIAHNLGYQVTSLLAGLGIGGLALALAAQDTLANFFGTIVVLGDRPFRVGDWVKVDGQEGVVEGIGFRSTRIRTFSKSLIVVPNKLLTEKQIENWSAMNQRRVKHSLGLLYSTQPEQMEAFVAGLRSLLETDPGVDPETITVSFTDFNASSLDVLVVYFTHAVPYNEHLLVRQRLNLAILRLAAAQGVGFAFPTRTVQLEQAR